MLNYLSKMDYHLKRKDRHNLSIDRIEMDNIKQLKKIIRCLFNNL